MKPYLIDADVVKIDRKAGSENLWEGYEFGNPVAMSRDFIDFHDYAAGDWTITAVGAGSVALTNAANGALLITNAAADNDLQSLQKVGAAWVPAIGRTLYFEAKFQVSDATQSDFLIGLVVTDTSPLTNANGIYFRKDDGDALIDFETNASSVASTDSGIHTLVTATDLIVGFRVTGTSLVEYFVNDKKIGEFTQNIPTSGLRPTIHLQNGEAVAKTATIDYMFIAQSR